MQNEETDYPAPEKHDRGFRRTKGCCLLAATVILILFALAVAAIMSIVILDSINTRGEEFTLSQRMERYKVAGQFLWFDFKNLFSRKSSDEPPPENDPFY